MWCLFASDRSCSSLAVRLPSSKSHHRLCVFWRVKDSSWKYVVFRLYLICQQAEQSSVCFHVRFIQAMCSLKCLREQLEDRNLFQLANSSSLYTSHSPWVFCYLLLHSHSLASLPCLDPNPHPPCFLFVLQAKSCICHMCGAHLNRLHSCLYCVFFGCFTKKHIHEHAKSKRHNLGKWPILPYILLPTICFTIDTFWKLPHSTELHWKFTSHFCFCLAVEWAIIISD